MARLWSNDPSFVGGKYLVQRRDGTVPEWPWFVLGGADPLAPWALRLYAVLAFLIGWDRRYAADVWRLARDYDRYRRDPANRKGDPDAPRHRVDDPAIVAKMAGSRGA